MSSYVRTPLVESFALSSRAPYRVYLKMENCQPSGSFKLRGVSHLVGRAAEERGATAIAIASGGNAGLAAAYSAQKLGLACTVVVPETTGEIVRTQLESLGALVRVEGRVWDEANAVALELAKEGKTEHVPPFDHPLLWEGHASMVHELAEDLGSIVPDLVVLSVGGGGLMCGVARGMDQVNWGHVPILAMETRGADCLNVSLGAGRVTTLPGITSFANCLGALTPAEAAYSLCLRRNVISEVVTDREAAEACIRFLDDERVLVEPACGAALAALYSDVVVRLQRDGKLPADLTTVVVVVCGGRGVSLSDVLQWKHDFAL